MKTYLLIFLFITDVTASITMGKETYAKECKQCHLSLKSVASNKQSKRWKELLSKEGHALGQVHLNTQEAKPSWRYFKSSKYKKQSNDLKDVLIKYSADKSKHTSCH